MDALRAEIEKRKQRTEELKAKTGASKKFIRRGDINALERQEQEKRRQAFEREREERQRRNDDEKRGGAILHERLIKKRKHDQTQTSSTVLENSADATESEAIDLPPDEVKSRLRSMGQVVTYFGETDSERYHRLRKVETEGVAGDDDFAVRGGHDTRNIFLDQDSRRAAADDDEDYDEDEDDSPRKQQKQNNQADSEGAQIRTGQAADQVLGEGEEKKEIDDHKMVSEYFKGLLRQWEMQLNERPDHIKRTAQGKIDTKTQKQCKDYIRPLFKLCKRKEVPPDILHNLKRMIQFSQEGEFVKANDAYIQTAIGNAAWPIGITLVGIHQRSAHDGLQVGQVAHVMNNEMQRKYLQSVKRLIRFAQSLRPDVPPSKKVQ